MHPMLREDAPRRKLGPVIFHKSNSQDKLIEELQGKLGIGRQERWKGRQEDWLTEGVIVTSTPLRTRQDSGPGGQQVQRESCSDAARLWVQIRIITVIKERKELCF